MNWKLWPNFDDDGEPDGKTIVGDDTGRAIFCSVAATKVELKTARIAPETRKLLEEFCADVRCADPEAVREDWPDLYETYRKAKAVLYGK